MDSKLNSLLQAVVELRQDKWYFCFQLAKYGVEVEAFHLKESGCELYKGCFPVLVFYILEIKIKGLIS